jgi:hypothetical protein
MNIDINILREELDRTRRQRDEAYDGYRALEILYSKKFLEFEELKAKYIYEMTGGLVK